MDSFVNGVATAPSTHGAVTGTSGNDRIGGSNGTDHLVGGKGVDYLYGSAGNDAFLFRLSDFDATLGHAVQDYVQDFGGAGGWVVGNNDFLTFLGFGAGSTLTLDAARTAHAQSLLGGDPTLQYYIIHSATTGQDFEIFIHSTNGHTLVAGDYAFYG